MPFYEYSCGRCGHRFEKRLRLEERTRPQVCPSCRSEGAELRMSVPAVVGSAQSSAAEGPAGFCPSTGRACGCAHAVHN